MFQTERKLWEVGASSRIICKSSKGKQGVLDKGRAGRRNCWVALVPRCRHCVKSNQLYPIVKNTTSDCTNTRRKRIQTHTKSEQSETFAFCRPAGSCHVLFLRPGCEAILSPYFSPCSISCRISAFIATHLISPLSQDKLLRPSAAQLASLWPFNHAENPRNMLGWGSWDKGSCEMLCICHILSWDSAFRLAQSTNKLSCKIFNAATVDSS